MFLEPLYSPSCCFQKDVSTGANSLEPFYDETSFWDVEEGDSREEPYPKDRSDSLEEPISEEHLVWDRDWVSSQKSPQSKTP